jgi:hypothetical protein
LKDLECICKKNGRNEETNDNTKIKLKARLSKPNVRQNKLTAETHRLLCFEVTETDSARLISALTGPG